MGMYDPPHPGEIIKELCLDPLGLSLTEAAEGLGVSRKTLTALLDGNSSVSAEIAIRFSKAFGGSAESWLRHQMKYDLWHLRKRADEIKVKVFYDPSKQRSVPR